MLTRQLVTKWRIKVGLTNEQLLFEHCFTEILNLMWPSEIYFLNFIFLILSISYNYIKWFIQKNTVTAY